MNPISSFSQTLELDTPKQLDTLKISFHYHFHSLNYWLVLFHPTPHPPPPLLYDYGSSNASFILVFIFDLYYLTTHLSLILRRVKETTLIFFARSFYDEAFLANPIPREVVISFLITMMHVSILVLPLFHHLTFFYCFRFWFHFLFIYKCVKCYVVF